MKNVLIIGHSHIGCLMRAHAERGGRVDGLSIEFAPIGADYYKPNLDAQRARFTPRSPASSPPRALI